MTVITPLTREQQATLMRDLNPQRVLTRGQGKRKLSYLAAYDVKATLTRVFGFGGFSANVIESEIINVRTSESVVDGKTKYFDTISVKVTVELKIPQLGVTYIETAASSQSGSQGFGDVADFAFKTAASDALKRCAIYFGTQFGLSLYNNGGTQDVIMVCVAPGQEYWNGQPQKTQYQTVAPAADTPVTQDPEFVAEPLSESEMKELEGSEPQSQQQPKAQIDPDESERRHQAEMDTLAKKLNQS